MISLNGSIAELTTGYKKNQGTQEPWRVKTEKNSFTRLGEI